WDRDFGWIYRTAILIAFLVVLISAPFWILGGRRANTAKSLHSGAVHLDNSDGQSPSSLSDSAAIGGISQHPLYPYSIIPGGAHSREELVRAIENDPVVARHYADFKVAGTRVIRLEHSELMYVSYRMGNTVFWTKTPLLLPAGETVLTDGTHTARTRCGNRLSATPVAPVLPNQPRPEAMDIAPDLTPFVAARRPELSMLAPPMNLIPSPAETLTPPTLALDGPIGALQSPIPPVYFPILGSGPPPPNGPPIVPPPVLPSPVSTPEPGTLTLLLAGFAMLLLVYWRRSKGRSAQSSKL
ncbi:MAG TPA: PEP-CTERM sorting domain-containing protein, partial [Candidatus Acidoferrales bacterium]|nr:PEP-CTERM sorting domain-containing protein [Candidatus Acidoferrales bacterium]